MTDKTIACRSSSFADLREAYLEMTATPAFQRSFDAEALSIVPRDETLAALALPDPMAAQHDTAAIIATVFDLFRGTRLETSAAAIAWGIVNSFHHEAQKLERQEDAAAQKVGELARRADPSEIASRALEEAQELCQALAAQRAAIACMRDYAAEVYRVETGRPWSAARGSKVSSATTASQIAAVDFLKARAQAWREKRHPTGPVVVFSGGAVWHDWQPLWDRLDQIKARVPNMTLVTTAQRSGCDAIAAAWAASRSVPLVCFTLNRTLGNKAGFARNKQLVGLKPVEAIVCEGSGLQANLYQRLRATGVPIHAFRAKDQAPANATRAMTA